LPDVFVILGLEDVTMVAVPVADGVKVNVSADELADHERLVGENDPPTPVEDRLIVPVYTPFGVTVKLVEATETIPDDGPDVV